MITFLKIFFGIVFVWMCYVIISTSLTHNLFKEWDSLNSAWMHATLWDFYANILIIYCWILYKEPNWFLRVLWLVLLFCFGSIASCGFVLIQLFRLKPGEGVKELVANRNG